MHWTTVVHSGRAEGPPLAHPLWCRESTTPATLSDPGTHRGRVERPPLAHPLWCRETAASATCPSMWGLPRSPTC
eukprot:4144754-Pyramimonas_sp.AAC.1